MYQYNTKWLIFSKHNNFYCHFYLFRWNFRRLLRYPSLLRKSLLSAFSNLSIPLPSYSLTCLDWHYFFDKQGKVRREKPSIFFPSFLLTFLPSYLLAFLPSYLLTFHLLSFPIFLLFSISWLKDKKYHVNITGTLMNYWRLNSDKYNYYRVMYCIGWFAWLICRSRRY